MKIAAKVNLTPPDLLDPPIPAITGEPLAIVARNTSTSPS
jgi:hypothetical protein